jgi:hypothetical protein
MQHLNTQGTAASLPGTARANGILRPDQGRRTGYPSSDIVISATTVAISSP